MGPGALLPGGGGGGGRRRKGGGAVPFLQSPVGVLAALAATLIVLGIAFPAPIPLPCGGSGGGWQHILRLDANDARAVDRSHKKTVYVAGMLKGVSLNDEEFQFLREGIALRRSVEMFQWARDKTTKEGFTRLWSPTVIDSKGFPRGKLNPLVMPFSNHTQTSLPIRLEGMGMLRMDPSLVPLLGFYQREHVVEQDLDRLPADLLGTVRVTDGYFFRGRDMQFPSVGDVRVSFYLVPGGDVSVIAKLRGRTLETCLAERAGAGRMRRPGSHAQQSSTHMSTHISTHISTH